jgi:hypothetical protein
MRLPIVIWDVEQPNSYIPLEDLCIKYSKADIVRSSWCGQSGAIVESGFFPHLEDIGEKELKLPVAHYMKSEKESKGDDSVAKAQPVDDLPKPPFVITLMTTTPSWSLLWPVAPAVAPMSTNRMAALPCIPSLAYQPMLHRLMDHLARSL